ncbi:MAG: type IV secretory system conjugative DNA transfer family protein [Solirubrobacteraceae bacterium]|jgi:type IV secretion system protein VirD4
MIALLLTLTSFAAFTAAGLWVTRALSAAQREGQARVPAPPAEPEDPWIARPDAASIAGTHVWAGQTTAGVLHTPADCAAIVVGPPKAGKTRKVIAPTLACWDGPALVTSTKGDVLQSAAHRARLGPVAVYDPTGSLGCPEVSVGFSPLSRCETWDGAVEVAAALLSPASADESVRHGEHFAIAARALLAPLFHAAALSDGGIDQARGWLGRSEFSEPAEILRGQGATIALEELSGVAAQAVGDYRTSVLGTAQVALAWASRVAVRASTDSTLTPQLDLGELIAQQGTLYVVSPSRIQEELAPLIAALLDGLCAHAIDLAITSPTGRLEHPLLLALDEVANIAPIRSLPRLLSEGIQQGIVPVLGLQDMSQARARWGEHETATMWSTPALRLVLAGVADPYTAQLVSDACGEQLVWRPQISENTSTSHQVERAGKTYTGGDSHSYAQQRERTVQPADLRAMPAGRALALPQGREPIGVDLFAGAPGLSDCDWQALCRAGRERLCNPL